jgi:hypothetical protein
MANRTSIYIPDHLRRIIDQEANQDGGESLSGRLASIVDRFGLICDRHTPAFSRAEWCLMLDACNGWASWSQAGQTLMLGVAAEVADAVRCAALVGGLRAMTVAETIATVERIERFWRRGALPTDAAMAGAGIVPIEPLVDPSTCRSTPAGRPPIG